jgi:pyruvate dehydrogenase E2 component (dihydrolipoamide acetyltransferase)
MARGAPIAYIVDTADEARTGLTPTAEAATLAAATSPPANAVAAQPEHPARANDASPSGAAGSGVRASPYARALAHDLGVDLATVAAAQSGPIGAAELLKAVARPALTELEEGPPYRLERASTLRESVARYMIASAATPVFHLSARLPLQELQQLARQKSYSLTLLLARACALTIKAHPLFNAAYTPAGLAQRDRVDIGIAADLPDGLVTPVLRDVAQRPLPEISRDWDLLREKLRTRRLTAQDYRGATFYLSDLGIFPVVDGFDSILPIGASAILSVAATRRDGGALCTLTCDHRVVFGADAARLLTTLNEWLSNPGTLVA